MAKTHVPRIPINTSVSPKEYEIVKNRAEVFHCSRAAVIRYALYIGLKQLTPHYPVERPPEADIFE